MTLDQWHIRCDIERLIVHLEISRKHKKIIYDKLIDSLANLVPIKDLLLKKFLDNLRKIEKMECCGKMCALSIYYKFVNDNVNHMNGRTYDELKVTKIK